jgi:hypothetical protein
MFSSRINVSIVYILELNNRNEIVVDMVIWKKH